MRKLLFILFTLTANLVLVAQQVTLEKAEKAYDNKRFKEAVSLYEKLIGEGYKSTGLYFNLANAYYRNNDIGKAIYYYELARKIDPHDEDVRLNLGIASSKTIDKIDSKENFFLSAVKTNVLSTLTTTTWGWLTVIFIVLACILFFAFVSTSHPRLKRVSFAFSGLFFVAFLFAYFLGYSALRSKYDNKFAIVLSKEVKVVNEPTAAGTTKFTLHEGTKIRVIERNGDWVLIGLDNGNEGWLHMGDVGII
jgi:tetratricopeptide (TPR) repeat protein